jgi:acetyl-CoA/propionyl-CoA carboxylase biotin carboxyl carrier protein
VRKVLIANRGEIAVRVARACRDAGIASVAVYADSDRDAPHARFADEAIALGGDTAGQTYLRTDKILAVAARTGADAVHPGYGFLAENADAAQQVLDAGLIWIGPPPAAIRDLGDKVRAREIARRVGAPLAPGMSAPAGHADEIVAFAREHGLPVAVKAAYGGGGRGLKVARTLAEIPALFESATREAVAAFGRGECFAERFLERPRHVEAQVLADRHGTVLVLGTRDCTLQRRHQKLVEEAPAPFLTAAQRTAIHDAATAVCREVGYVGAGTVEFLVADDGSVSFLEVNPRLQVEHPVTEETTGVDLVREQLRVAAGERLTPDGPPAARGHSIEFRINSEDPGRGFLPSTGTVTTLRLPAGPGVRVDTGIEAGAAVSGAFDSLLAKVIITGATRREALARAGRALDEMVVDGVATTLPFHRLVVRDDAFVDEPFRVHTGWITSEWDNTVPPYDGPTAAVGDGAPEAGARTTVVVEVDGRRLDVTLPAGWGPSPAGRGASGGNAGGGRSGAPRRRAATGAGTGPAGDALTSPMQGTIVKVAVSDGDTVAEGELIVVLEAMKMEQPLYAHRAGVVGALSAEVGATVAAGATICVIS